MKRVSTTHLVTTDCVWLVLLDSTPFPQWPFRVPGSGAGRFLHGRRRARSTHATATNCEGDHQAPVAAPSGALHRGGGTLAPVRWGGKADEMVFGRPATHWKRGRSRAGEARAAHSFNPTRNARETPRRLSPTRKAG